MTSSGELSRDEAQRRADRIRAFREEFAAAERDGALALGREQRASLDAYHERLLADLSRAYDVDRSEAQHHLSLGMRIVSLLGAAALTGAVVLFFLDIWGSLTSAIQVAIAWAAPLVALAGAAYAARIERTLYVTAILSFLALGCFVLDVSVLGTVLNARPSSTPLLVWSAFALILAYTWDLAWLLALGAVSFVAFFATTAVWIAGFPLDVSLQRPELLLLPAAAVFAASMLDVNARRAGFPVVLRRVGLLTFFLAVLVLGEAGSLSFLPWTHRPVELLYQLVGFLCAAGAVSVGIRRGWRDVLNIGAGFFGLLLLLRYVDWWWDWMPTWLFFMIVAVTAIASLLALRRVRGAVSGVGP